METVWIRRKKNNRSLVVKAREVVADTAMHKGRRGGQENVSTRLTRVLIERSWDKAKIRSFEYPYRFVLSVLVRIGLC